LQEHVSRLVQHILDWKVFKQVLSGLDLAQGWDLMDDQLELFDAQQNSQVVVRAVLLA